jgi:pyruvate/2-oxoacid:ferredoxin oxidoreductase alpha subunit
MHEQLHWAAGARVPIVMALANRGLGAPWTIYNDMQDSISQRDTGWMQVYCRDNQEILDSILMAYKICERLHVPMMVCFDGFVLSHTVMPIELPDQEKVDAFLPTYVPHVQVDGPEPININPVVLAEPRLNALGVACPSYMGFRMRLQETLERARDVILEVGQEFGESFGRSYDCLLWKYRTEEADTILLTMGSLGNEASLAVDMLREKGCKAGAVTLRVFRPFPGESLRQALSGAKHVVIFDKNISYGNEGATSTETKAALFEGGLNPAVSNYIVGLGGKTVVASHLEAATLEALQHKGRGNRPRWLGAAV